MTRYQCGRYVFALFTVLTCGLELPVLTWQRHWQESHKMSAMDLDFIYSKPDGGARKAPVSSKLHPSCDPLVASLGSCSSSKPRPPKIFECPRCHQKFGHPRSIYRHRKACEGQFDFKCEVCGKSFHRLDSLKSHAQKHSADALAQVCSGQGSHISHASSEDTQTDVL